MNWLTQKVIVSRAQEYLLRYQPVLIGLSGGLNQTMIAAALELLLSGHRYLRISPYPFQSPLGTALDILGLRTRHRPNWWHVLTRSRLQELVAAEPDTIAVELGPYQPGDLDRLTRWFPFQVGLVASVPTRRLDLFGEPAMVAHELTSLIISLPSDGYAILNADDPLVAAMRSQTTARVITFGRAAAADFCLKHLQRQGTGFAGEVVNHPHTIELYLPHLVTTEHVTAALAALALTPPFELNLSLAASRLTRLQPPAGYGRLLAGTKGSHLLDSSLDAQPEDAIAGLNALRELPARRRIAVLGDITGLGAASRRWHQEIGHRVALVADMFIAVGQAMRDAGAIALQQPKIDVHHFPTSRAAAKWLGDYVTTDDLVFITGSDSLRMETVTARLLADPLQDSHHLPRPVKF